MKSSVMVPMLIAVLLNNDWLPKNMYSGKRAGFVLTIKKFLGFLGLLCSLFVLWFLFFPYNPIPKKDTGQIHTLNAGPHELTYFYESWYLEETEILRYTPTSRLTLFNKVHFLLNGEDIGSILTVRKKPYDPIQSISFTEEYLELNVSELLNAKSGEQLGLYVKDTFQINLSTHEINLVQEEFMPDISILGPEAVYLSEFGRYTYDGNTLDYYRFINEEDQTFENYQTLITVDTVGKKAVYRERDLLNLFLPIVGKDQLNDITSARVDRWQSWYDTISPSNDRFYFKLLYRLKNDMKERIVFIPVTWNEDGLTVVEREIKILE